MTISNGYAPLWMQWASYQICKIAGCACAGNVGNVSSRRWIQRKLLVSDPGMHHGTCVTHVSWYMSGSLTHGGGENVPGIPGACASAILRIWQEAHATEPIDDKFILGQEIPWCRRRIFHYLSQWWPWSMSPSGPIEPQNVKTHRHNNKVIKVITFVKLP